MSLAEDMADALDRLDRAMKRGTGCYLTQRMMNALAVSHIGEIAGQPRTPRSGERADLSDTEYRLEEVEPGVLPTKGE